MSVRSVVLFASKYNRFLSVPTCNNANARGYAFKSDLKIKWVRPEKISCIKPEKSGDLEPMPKIDLTQYQLEYRKSKELETANDLVKRLFTLEFAPNFKVKQSYINDIVGRVKRHPYDKSSVEAKIARWTGSVRALQDVMEKYPRNKRLKVKLKELIDGRNKQLKYLRRWDYKKFEWLIENLNIVYKPLPDDIENVTRKDSLRKLTKRYCDGVVNERLTSYKAQLKEEQGEFLKEKLQSLRFIQSEEIECGVEPTVLEEIDKVKKELEEFKKGEENNV